MSSYVVWGKSVGSKTTTPLSPTALKASAIIFPSLESLFVEIVATWSIISPVTGIDIFSKYLIKLWIINPY